MAKAVEGTMISIHAPSRERLGMQVMDAADGLISIHAPSRERLDVDATHEAAKQFQSTLPHGSDYPRVLLGQPRRDFNPRSLTGATCLFAWLPQGKDISIHAPSRERPAAKALQQQEQRHFNPRSLTGATSDVSILLRRNQFQSTLPHGSDPLFYLAAHQ